MPNKKQAMVQAKAQAGQTAKKPAPKQQVGRGILADQRPMGNTPPPSAPQQQGLGPSVGALGNMASGIGGAIGGIMGGDKPGMPQKQKWNEMRPAPQRPPQPMGLPFSGGQQMQRPAPMPPVPMGNQYGGGQGQNPYQQAPMPQMSNQFGNQLLGGGQQQQGPDPRAQQAMENMRNLFMQQGPMNQPQMAQRPQGMMPSFMQNIQAPYRNRM